MEGIYVFDVDGVLLDVRERLELAKKLSKGSKTRFWQIFFSEELLELDKPRTIGIEMLLDRCRKGSVAIVTGRPRRLERATLNQLVNVCRVPRKCIWRLAMRRDGDTRPSWQVKLELVLNMVYEGLEILEIHDDDEEFLSKARRYLPKTKLFLHRDNFVEQL